MSIVKSILKNQKGIGLVEVIGALGITMLVITSLVGLSLYTLKSSIESTVMLEATRLANREIELVRAYRDTRTSWYGFTSGIDACRGDSSQCYVTIQSGTISVNSGVKNDVIAGEDLQTWFSVDPDPPAPSTERIRVTVTWNVGGLSKSTHVYTDLSNWRNK